MLTTPAQMTTESVRGEAMEAINTALNFGVFVGVTGGLFADRFTRELGIIVSSVFFAASVVALLLFLNFSEKISHQAEKLTISAVESRLVTEIHTF